MELPQLPQPFDCFIPSLNKASTRQQVADLVEPYKNYESKLRQIYAQEPAHAAVSANHLVPVFADQSLPCTVRARDLTVESAADKDKFLLPLSDDRRRKDGSPATVGSLKDFKYNFHLFSESALVDLDWSNVVAAGSSVVTPLLPVDAPHNESKRAMRTYYHELLAPASDVDLFIYGLNEEQALEKIKQIEARVRDSILSETTTVRTKNAITIVSEYPTRHIQIVLRLYKSVSEILTGFDVDCACVAYDGQQVWASPRAIGAFATQTNSIDLTRRSPSYENRLSKYAQRGFEVYWPHLNRSKIDPTIYERAFTRVQGLARLLVLEKLPHPHDRDEYLTKRRAERGRPELPWNARYRHELPGNVKDAQPQDVAEWVDEGDVSSYHTFTIPYGQRYPPKKVEKLVYTKDLLLNAEWNKPKDRKVNLHRHPAFFGTVEEVAGDCCGFCPKPVTDEDLAVWEEESKSYITGKLQFMKDDPGRQAIGSFNPLTDDDWTEMAYVGNTARLCQAIVDNDLEEVLDWFATTEDADVNRRDHTGRTPLHLAAIGASPEVVSCLIERGARIVSRLYNGLTALHLAAHRGNAKIVKLLLEKSQQNEEEESRKEDLRKQARRAAANQAVENDPDTQMSDVPSDTEDIMEQDLEEEGVSDAMTEGSFVKVEKADEQTDPLAGDDKDEPDVYDVDVLAWDCPVSPLHLAIMAGNKEVVATLIDGFGADVMLPVKVKSSYFNTSTVILPLILPLELPLKQASDTVSLLLDKGSSPSHADMHGQTALHYVVNSTKTAILDLLQQKKSDAVSKILDHLVITGYNFSPAIGCPILTAIRSGEPEMVQRLLNLGASPTIKLESFAKAYQRRLQSDESSFTNSYHRNLTAKAKDPKETKSLYQKHVTQPIIQAALQESMIDIVDKLLEAGADVNSMTTASYEYLERPGNWYESIKSLLDIIKDHRKSLEAEIDPLEGERIVSKPESLQSDEVYLQNLQPGSYQYWRVSKALAEAKAIHADLVKAYEKTIAAQQEKSKSNGVAEKQKAMQELAQKYAKLEEKLVSKGAKTFDELYPEHAPQRVKPRKREVYSPFNPYSKDPWDASFQVPLDDFTEEKREAYIKLFEAAYAGDTETVKFLCLTEKISTSPLQVAVTDENGFSPFSLALLRGHRDLAQTILEIAAAQYELPKPKNKKRYVMRRGNLSETCSDDDSEEGSQPEIEAEDVDGDYSVEDVAVRPTKVKCDVRPSKMLSWTCELWRLVDVDMKDAKDLFRPNRYGPSSLSYGNHPHPWSWFRDVLSSEQNRVKHSLFRYAVVTNDLSLLNFLLEAELKYQTDEDGPVLDAVAFPHDVFALALKFGRTEMIGEIIKQRGVLLPLKALSSSSGVQIEETTKYYQGLDVHGKKRKDWAKKANQGQRNHELPPLDRGSPLLAAILDGTLDVIDYFMSDAPFRHYQEFAAKFKDDPRVRQLEQAPGGFAAALEEWMKTRVNLVFHMAVMAWDGGSLPRLKHLIERMPVEYLEAKNVEGETALHVAFRRENIPAIEVLLAAGANAMTRNSKGENILHTIYSMSQTSGPEIMKKLVSLLGRPAVESMIRQRSQIGGTGFVTPLASILPTYQVRTKKEVVLLDTMLGISGGKDLEVIDGAGDYPLHAEVRAGNLLAVRLIASKRPDLLYRENATGMTPMEVAESQYFQERISKAPRIPESVSRTWYSYELNAEGGKGIKNKPVKDFVKDVQKDEDDENAELDAFEGLEDDGDFDDIPTTHTMYRLVRKLAQKDPGKRTLVTVLDANEVAKRLAFEQAKKNEAYRQREARGVLNNRFSRYHDYRAEENERLNAPRDESTEAIGNTDLRRRLNPWREWVKKEGVEAAVQRYRDFAEGRGIKIYSEEGQGGYLGNEIDDWSGVAV